MADGEEPVGHRKTLRIALTALCLGVGACASVPEETVTLSYAVGQDLEQLHQGYRETVRMAFAQMRAHGLAVIDDVWTPAYLKTFVKEGDLVGIVKEENWEDLEGWARAAIEDIDAKRKEFLDPLNEREQALLNKVDEAFARALRANAAVTANLNSVIKVQNLQDQVLDAAGMKELRDQINDAIVEVSDFAAKATKEIGDASAALRKGENAGGAQGGGQ